jgi:hypothetical protein
MKPAVMGLALFAAVLHATWNVLLRSCVDRLWSVTVMSFATTLAAIPLALVLPLPLTASWPYLAISGGTPGLLRHLLGPGLPGRRVGACVPGRQG